MIELNLALTKKVASLFGKTQSYIYKIPDLSFSEEIPKLK
jgi:hypothetical protein